MITLIALPQPQGLKFQQWGALVAEQLAAFGISAPDSDEAWQTWASSLNYVPELAVIPDPAGFNDWETWACRVLETL
jgi:hypothetical protein